MMKKILIAALLLATSFTSYAQNVSGGCYRGFVDAGYTFGLGDYDMGRIEVNTSHGYQINPYFFVGAGAGLHFTQSYGTEAETISLDIRESKVDIPVFANLRVNFLKKKFSPFFDIKGGTYINNNGGLYVNGSLGCRIATNEKQAFNVSVGYTLEKLEFETFNHFVGYSMNYTRYGRQLETEGLTLKVGYEF